jgi:hypothetical protein
MAGVDAPPGWHYTKKDDIHGFGMYGLGDRPSGLRDEERIRRTQEARIRREREEKELRSGALPVALRDVAIRNLSKDYGLCPKHRKELRDRGLTDDQINARLFFSIVPGEPVRLSTPANLPGVRWGKLTGSPGFACVGFDHQGRANGWQVRLTDPEDIAKGGKYRWAFGAARSHLPNGELPITVAIPEVIEREGIGISEGLLKPQIGSVKYKQPFIGASAFHFTKDEKDSEGKIQRVLSEQFLEALESLSTKLDTDTIVLYPDAGVVTNRRMFEKYEQLYQLVKKIERKGKGKYKIVVAWHGQIWKGTPDFDELENPSVVRNIPFSFFKELAQLFGGCDTLKQAEIRKKWKLQSQYTADTTDTSEFVTLERAPAQSIVGVKAGLGRGKTMVMKKLTEEYREESYRTGEDQRFIVPGYRNTLLYQTAAKIKFFHIHDQDAGIMISDPNGGICLCVDSLPRLKVEDFDGAIVYLDEIASVIRHMLHSSTCKRNRLAIIYFFCELIRRASVVYVFDAHLKDIEMQYLGAIAEGKKRIIKYENTFKAPKPDVTMLLGTYDLSQEIKKNNRSPLIADMLLQLRTGNKIAIGLDSRIEGEALAKITGEGLAKITEEAGFKVLRLDSKTTPEAWAKEFLEDPNGYILKHQFDVVIYSPSAESGLDINLKGYFARQYCFFFGVIGVDSMLQMMMRIRDTAVDRFVWCKQFGLQNERANSNSCHHEEVEEAQERLYEMQVGMAMSELPLSPESSEAYERGLMAHLRKAKDEHFRMSARLQAISNAERMNTRSFLVEKLRSEGFKVSYSILDQLVDVTQIEKDAKEAVKRQESRDIFTAPVAEEEIADLAREKTLDASYKEQCRRNKAKVLFRYPGINKTFSWNEETIYFTRFEDRDFLSHCEFAYLYDHPEEATRQKVNWVNYSYSQPTYLSDFTNSLLRCHVLKELGFDAFRNRDAVWTNSSPEVVEFVEKCKTRNNSLVLGHPGRLAPIQYIGKLLKWMGEGFSSSKDGEGNRSYRINETLLCDPRRLDFLAAIDRRCQELAQKSEISATTVQPYSPDTTAPDPLSINKEASGAVRNISPYSPDTTAPDPLSINKTAPGAVRNISPYSPDTTAPDPLSINKTAPGAVRNISPYSPDTTAPDPLSINKTASGAVRNISPYSPDTTAHEPMIINNNGSSAVLHDPCDNSQNLEGLSEKFKKDDLVLTPQGKGKVIYFDKGWQQYVVAFPDTNGYFNPWELSPFPLVEKSSEVPSPLPSEKISPGPSNGSSAVLPSPEVLAELKKKVALAQKSRLHALTLRAVASLRAAREAKNEKVSEAQESAQETTPAPTPVEQKIKIGSRVRYVFKGMQRYGMVGTVKGIVGNAAKIWLDYCPKIAELGSHCRDLEATFLQLELVE